MTISTQTAQPATCTVPEAGQALGISRQSAYQAARTGELPTVKIGRRLLVPRRALETMLGLENGVDPATLRDNEKRPAGEPGASTSSAGGAASGARPA